MQGQRKIKCHLWLPIPESRNGLRFSDLDRKGVRCEDVLSPSNDIFLTVDMIGCFCIEFSNGRCDHVDPGGLFVGLEFETSCQTFRTNPYILHPCIVFDRVARLEGTP
jgi:hypothetical protein